MYFLKYAKMTGEQVPSFIDIKKGDVDDVLPYYQDYIHTKAQEEKTPWYKSILGGLGIGAGVGAIGGAFSKNHGMGALVGGVIGASIGTLLGTIGKLIDDGEIEQAKKVIADSDFDYASKAALLKEIAKREMANELRDERRHLETISALGGR